MQLSAQTRRNEHLMSLDWISRALWRVSKRDSYFEKRLALLLPMY